MTLAIEVIAVLAVVFLLLFLLYRERHQNLVGHAPVNIGDVHGNVIVNQHPSSSTLIQDGQNNDPDDNQEKSSKIDEDDKDSEEIEETPFKVSTKAKCQNERTSGLRRRHKGTISEPSEEEPNKDRVFSTSSRVEDKKKKPELTQYSPLKAMTPPDSDKQICIESAKVETDMLTSKSSEQQDKSPTQVKKMVVEASSDLGIAEPEDIECKTDEVIKPWEFVVGRKGRRVKAPYCHLEFPPGAVDEPLKVTMEPNYKMHSPSEKEVLITPYVDFKTDKKIEFAEDIKISLRTGYTCTGKKKIPVKILWRENRSMPLRCIQKSNLYHEKFISFTARHFCGHCVSAEQKDFHDMSRYYFFAGYVREPATATRIFHWKLFQDCPLLFEQKCTYLKDKKVVIDPESFVVPYDHTLQMRIENGDIKTSNENHKDYSLTNMWGSRVDETSQFELENRSGREDVHLQVKYKIFGIHNRNGPRIKIKENHFLLHWAKIPTTMPHTINVLGDRATGISFNSLPEGACATGQQQSVQHQMSNVSDASSGYGSPPVSARTFSESFREGRSSARRQDSGLESFIEEESVETSPKSPDRQDSVFESMNETPRPSAHSTPARVSRAGDAPNSLAESNRPEDASTEVSLEELDWSFGEMASNSQESSSISPNTNAQVLERDESPTNKSLFPEAAATSASIASSERSSQSLAHPTSKDELDGQSISGRTVDEKLQLPEADSDIPTGVQEQQSILENNHQRVSEEVQEEVEIRDGSRNSSLSDPDSLEDECSEVIADNSCSSSASSIESAKSFSN
uniref:uncharacterized protein LOC120348466 isoform X1 n=1 Tax=Styela clava TaxID=7725 RepID=UPI00193A4702|nr:uncharacterized protein LOC120348466 isoform X1 [Styela clava]